MDNNEYILPYDGEEFGQRLELINKLSTIDSTPTEGSENLITSGGVYELIGNISTVISQINTLIGEDS